MIHIETLVFNSFQVNTYLVRDETGNCLVVDPAFYSPEEIKAFDAYISKNGLKVTGQINTHGHVDHVLGVHHMKSVYNCPFQAHVEEAGLVKNAPLMGEMFDLTVEPISGIDKLIEDRDIISIGKHSLEAILVPGHSPGSLSFYCAEGKVSQKEYLKEIDFFAYHYGWTKQPGGPGQDV